jgi:phosphonopyruvate decarboxylase
LARHRTDQIVVAAYHAAFDLLRIQPHPLNYFPIGAMGLASSNALGLALGRPDKRVVVLDGDGSLLMNLGALVTIAEVAPKNLIHFVCENGTYEANGGYPTPGRDTVSFSGFAIAAGIKQVYEFSDLAIFEAEIAGLLRMEGPVFATLKITPGDSAPIDWELIHGAKAREDFRAALKAA